MQISQRGINLIKRFESFRARAYKPDPNEEFWTIGYGHYGSDVHANEVITEAHAERILVRDLAVFVAAVNRLVTTHINQNRFDALVSLCFNIGIRAFTNSTVLKMVNKRRFGLASLAFGLWVIGASGRLRGLVRRRAAEVRLFNKSINRK